MTEPVHHLRFREDERREVAMSASITLTDADTGQLRVIPGVLSKHGRINGTLMDISSGGAGLVVSEYVPRWCRVMVGVHRSEEDGKSIVSAPGVVRRVQMLDRRPSYLLGVSFSDLDEDSHGKLIRLLSMIDGQEEIVPGDQQRC